MDIKIIFDDYNIRLTVFYLKKYIITDLRQRVSLIVNIEFKINF